MEHQKLVGSWKLLRWEGLLDGVVAELPFGEGALGQVVVSETGHMGAHLQRAEWASQPANADVGLFFIAYSGKFRIEGDRLITTVALGSVPAMVGSEQVRVVSFVGEHMQLEIPPEMDPTGRGLHHKLLWERC